MLLWNSASLLAALLAALLSADTTQSQTEAAAGLQEALVSVIINGELAREPVAVLRRPGNQIYVTAELLVEWRLGHHSVPAVNNRSERYFLLNAIPGIQVEVDEATQTLRIIAPAKAFQLTRLSHAPVEISDGVVGGTGVFANYDLSAQLADGDTSFGGAFETGVFTGFGVGLASLVGRWSDVGTEFIRLDTHWTMDDPTRMRALRFGDGITRGGVGASPLRFGGIQLARKFAVQPGFVTIPLPSLNGSAAVPSVVDIYVNDALRHSRDVRPGPFQIADVPIVTGSGDVRLIVRDLLGREQIFTQSYYASPNLLRAGLHDFSYEVGFLRRSFGEKSHDYGPLMLSATHRYGVSSNVTAELHAEASKDVQTAGVAANIALTNIGKIETSLAVSRSPLGEGILGGVGFERRTQKLAFGVKAEVTSHAYTSLGRTPEHRAPAAIIQGFAGVPIDFGSFGISYLRRDGRNERDVEYVSANASFRLGRFGNLHLAGRKSLKGDGDLSADLFLVVPFGGTSSSTGASLLNDRLEYKATFQKSAPSGRGIGYQLTASSGAIDQIDGRLTLNTSFGAYDAKLTWLDGKTGVRLSTVGGVGVVGGELFASRKLDQSFAMVQVGNYPNVRIYADNQLIGRTGASGKLVVPTLRPYDRNKLRMEVADLPMDAHVSDDERTIRPYDRHGVQVDFGVKASRSALIRILLEDGSPLPSGSVVTLKGQQSEFISAPGGEVYLTDLEATNVVIASWGHSACQLRLPFIATVGVQAKLGDFECLSVP